MDGAGDERGRTEMKAPKDQKSTEKMSSVNKSHANPSIYFTHTVILACFVQTCHSNGSSIKHPLRRPPGGADVSHYSRLIAF